MSERAPNLGCENLLTAFTKLLSSMLDLYATIPTKHLQICLNDEGVSLSVGKTLLLSLVFGDTAQEQICVYVCVCVCVCRGG